MAKLKISNLKTGILIKHNNSILRIVSTERVKPGKGPAYLQVSMKDIVKGTKIEERFRTSDAVEQASLDVIKHQFLYKKEDQYHFMNMNNYEQEALSGDIIGDKSAYLSEGMELEIEFLQKEAMNLILPNQISIEVKETEPVIKGQTATSSFKNATLKNGRIVQVPAHVKEGDIIILSTESNSYIKKI